MENKDKHTNPYREFKPTKVGNPLLGIKLFIGNGGLVPFEHGYKKPKFKFQGVTYECSMVSDSIAYCSKILSTTQRRRSDLLLSKMTKPQLNKLYNELKKYELYCKYEA